MRVTSVLPSALGVIVSADSPADMSGGPAGRRPIQAAPSSTATSAMAKIDVNHGERRMEAGRASHAPETVLAGRVGLTLPERIDYFKRRARTHYIPLINPPGWQVRQKLVMR